MVGDFAISSSQIFMGNLQIPCHQKRLAGAGGSIMCQNELGFFLATGSIVNNFFSIISSDCRVCYEKKIMKHYNHFILNSYPHL